MRNRNAFILAGTSIAFAVGLVFLSGGTQPIPPNPAGAATLADTETAIPRPSRVTEVSTLSVPVTVVRTAGAPAQVLPAQRIEVTRVVTAPPVTITRTAEPVPTTTPQETTTPQVSTTVPMP